MMVLMNLLAELMIHQKQKLLLQILQINQALLQDLSEPQGPTGSLLGEAFRGHISGNLLTDSANTYCKRVCFTQKSLRF